MPPLESPLSKNATVPSVHGGTLWPDALNKRFYLFGGEYLQPSSPPSLQGLWSYDIIYDYWEYMRFSGGPQATRGIMGSAYGAGATSEARGEAFWYGGWISEGSSAEYEPPSEGERELSRWMIRYRVDDNGWSNSSGPDDDLGRAEGVMVYIPAGDDGLLVYFGGVRESREGRGTSSGAGDGGGDRMFGNETDVVGQEMDEVFVYEILSGRWYKQKASGDIPGMRRRFCAGVAWAPDQSSYNM